MTTDEQHRERAAQLLNDNTKREYITEIIVQSLKEKDRQHRYYLKRKGESKTKTTKIEIVSPKTIKPKIVIKRK